MIFMPTFLIRGNSVLSVMCVWHILSICTIGGSQCILLIHGIAYSLDLDLAEGKENVTYGNILIIFWHLGLTGHNLICKEGIKIIFVLI